MSQRETVLEVRGMSCSSCVRHVSAALQSVPGVSSVQVALRAGTALVRHDAAASTSSMVQALDAAGYDARLSGAGFAAK
jgi:copper chaperone CopZ